RGSQLACAPWGMRKLPPETTPRSCQQLVGAATEVAAPSRATTVRHLLAGSLGGPDPCARVRRDSTVIPLPRTASLAKIGACSRSAMLIASDGRAESV